MPLRIPLIQAAAVAMVLAGMVFAADPAAEPNFAEAAAGVKGVIGHRGSCADRPDNSLAGVQRAIQVGAGVVEVDVRWTSDRALVCLHDETLDRTTNGHGPVGKITLAEAKMLDAGAKFNERFRRERIPTLAEVLSLAKGKIRVMLDLKETGDDYAKQIAEEVRQHGEPGRIVIGVRSALQAKQFGELLPEGLLIGLVPTLEDVAPFSQAGVPVIRLWPKWLADPAAVAQVRKLKGQLLIGTGLGTPDEVRPLLVHKPEYLSSDDPARLMQTLKEFQKSKD